MRLMKINNLVAPYCLASSSTTSIDTYLLATGLDMQTDIPTICLYVDDGRFNTVLRQSSCAVWPSSLLP